MKIAQLYKYYLDKNKFLIKYKWAPHIDSFSRTSKDLVNKEFTKHKKNIYLEGYDQVERFQTNIDNVWSKKRKFMKALKTKRKTFWLSRLIVRVWKIQLERKRFDFKNWVNYLGLNQKKGATVVGFTPDYIGAEPTKQISCNTIIYRSIVKEYRKLKPGQLKESITESLYNYREVWTGSFESNIPHLKKYFEPNKCLRSTANILDIALNAGDWFKVADADFEDPSELLWMYNMAKDTFNGHYTSRFLHVNKKSQSNKISAQIAMNNFEYIKKHPMKCYDLWDMFARAKDMKTMIQDGKEVTTRNVMTTEEHVQMLLGWFFQKVSWSTEKGKNPNTHFHVKGEFNSEKARKIWEKGKDYDFVLDADWSFFDSTNDTEYLEAASLLICSPSVKNDEMKRFMYFIISSIITKYIILPPGVVIELNRGQPSGHPGVTFVNCIVNLLRWAILGFRIYGKNYKDYMDVEVYGDDAVVFFKEHPNLSYLDKFCEEEGFTSDPLVDKLYPTILMEENPQEGPDFLKRVYSVEGIAWNRVKLFNKLLYPSRNRSNEDHILTVISFINTACADDEVNRFLIESIKNMILEVGTYELKESTVNIINDLINKGISDKVKSRFTNLTVNTTLKGIEKQINMSRLSIGEYIPNLNKKFSILMTFKEDSIKKLIAVSYPPLWINDNLKFLPNIVIKPKYVNDLGYIDYGFINRVKRSFFLVKQKPSCY